MSKPVPRKLWERLDGESLSAYQSFLVYRDMELTRNYDAVAKIMGKSYGTISAQAQRFDWKIRAAAWDDEVFREVSAEARKIAVEGSLKRLATSRRMLEIVAERLRTIKPGEISAKNLPTWFKIASEIERTELGQANRVISVTATDGNPSDSDVVKRLFASPEMMRNFDNLAAFLAENEAAIEIEAGNIRQIDDDEDDLL